MSVPDAGVWLDARGTQNPQHAERGIARYIAEHARALVQAEPAVEATIRLDRSRPVPPSLEALVGSGSLAWHTGTRPIGPDVPSIYHVMSPFELAIELDELWPHWAREPGVRTVVTLYDLIPLIYRHWYLDGEPLTAAQYDARLGLIREAHQVLTISRSTAEDAVRLLGVPEEQVTVIDSAPTTALPGLIQSTAEAASVVATALPQVRPGFLLYVGGNDPRKNMEGTIRAYAELPEELRRAHQLVIVCRLRWDQARDLRRHARELGIGPDQLVLAGMASDRELAALYRSCALFVFPSLYEGAGLPILEAMSCGAPVVASATSSIPEILGNEGDFDARQPGEISAAIRNALEEPGTLDALRRRSAERVGLFTWERVAERTLEGYERALEVPAAPFRRRRRKRLAVVTPWPPQPTGVASHSRRLVEHLAAHADVEVIVPSTEGDLEFDHSLEPEVPLRTDAEFAWLDELRAYDRRLYVLGHSRFHAHAYEALLRHPGIVLAHDVRLVGVYLDLSRRRHGFDPRWLEGKLRDMYGDRIPARDLRLAGYDDVYARYGLYMSAEVQAHAERMLVHSHFQEDILRLDAQRPAPSAIVPHGIPRIEPNGDRPQSGGPLIVSYGGVEVGPKRLDLVLRAFAEVTSAHPGARLALVGSGPPGEIVAIETLAADLGIGERVELPGRVNDVAYWDILRRADLAVQLRGGVNAGEASGAVCDCIAARVPTIVTDAGWFSELPEGVLLPLPATASAERVADLMRSTLGDEGLRERIAAAQEGYASETSFERVAERYADVLDL